MKRLYYLCFVWPAVCLAWLCVGLSMSFAGEAGAETKSYPKFHRSEAVPVMVWNREITRLRASFENFTPEMRARSIEERILAIPSGELDYRVEAKDATLGDYNGAWILVNNRVIFGLMLQDSEIEGEKEFEAYKQKTVANLKNWLQARAEQEKWPLLIESLALAIGATFGLGMTIIASIRFGSRWLAKRGEAVSDLTAKPIVIGDVNIKPYLFAFEQGLFKLFLWAFCLTSAYIWLTYVLNRFPYSQPWGANLKIFLFELFSDFGRSIVLAIPDLFTVLVIFLLTRLVVRVVKAFFISAETGLLSSAWLQPESARATRRMIVFLIWIFALVIAYPYIPGSRTEAFKGVSVFIGLMISLGSAGMVGQVVGGLVVVYSRAFRIGDFVRIGEYEGTIHEIGVLSTKMLTLKKEEITIPNAVLVGSTTVNYSRNAVNEGAFLSTTVTIGYETPWRQVQALLMLAAERTSGILKSPEPRVLQRALADFYTEYQLIFQIQEPEKRYIVLSALHGNIQDAFNEFGVQIMSPHFEMQPPDPIVVAKDNWHKAPAKPEPSDS